MLKLTNISKSFGDKTVLDDINLTFSTGEIVFVVGKSGCGKSTLLNIIGALDNASCGDVLLDDKVVNINDNEYKKKTVGFVFQDFNLISGMNIKHNIALSKSNYDKDWIIANVQNLGLDENQMSQHLSGGEKQRVALLRALYKDAKIILADEPTGNLDSENSELVMQYLKALKSNDKIIVVVTHDIELAMRFGDRIIRLRDGKIDSDDVLSKDVDIDTDCSKYNSYIGTNYTPIGLSQTINDSENRNRYFANISLVKNNIKRHYARALCIMVLLIVAISFVSMSISQYITSRDNLFNASTIGDMDIVTLKSTSSSKSDFSSHILSIDLDNINRISQMDEVSAVVPQYTNTSIQSGGPKNLVGGYEHIGFSVDRDLNFDWQDFQNATFTEKSQMFDNLNTTPTNVRAVESTDFFKKRYFKDDFDGQFPSAQNQVVLDKPTSEVLFGHDINPIGKMIYAHLDVQTVINLINFPTDSIPSGIPVTVVGVSNSPYLLPYKGEKSAFFSIVHSDLLKAVQTSWLKFLYDSLDSDSSSIYLNISTSLESTSSIYSTVDKAITSSDIIDGILPISINQIAISSKYRDMLDERYGSDSWQNINFSPVLFNNYVDGLSTGDKFFVKIVGVYESNDESIYLPPPVIDALKTQIQPTQLQVYLKDPTKWQSFKNKVNSDDMRFEVVSNLNSFLENTINTAKSISSMVYTYSLMLVVIVVISLAVLTKLSVLSRRYEIGVLKSLGYSAFRIIRVYLLEILILSLFAFGLSFLLNILCNHIFLQIYDDSKYFILYPSFLYTTMALLIVFAISAILNLLFVSSTARASVSKLFGSAR